MVRSKRIKSIVVKILALAMVLSMVGMPTKVSNAAGQKGYYVTDPTTHVQIPVIDAGDFYIHPLTGETYPKNEYKFDQKTETFIRVASPSPSPTSDTDEEEERSDDENGDTYTKPSWAVEEVPQYAISDDNRAWRCADGSIITSDRELLAVENNNYDTYRLNENVLTFASKSTTDDYNLPELKFRKIIVTAPITTSRWFRLPKSVIVVEFKNSSITDLTQLYDAWYSHVNFCIIAPKNSATWKQAKKIGMPVLVKDKPTLSRKSATVR